MFVSQSFLLTLTEKPVLYGKLQLIVPGTDSYANLCVNSHLSQQAGHAEEENSSNLLLPLSLG